MPKRVVFLLAFALAGAGFASDAEAQKKLGAACRKQEFNACYGCCVGLTGPGDVKDLRHCQKQCAKTEGKLARKKARRRAKRAQRRGGY